MKVRIITPEEAHNHVLQSPQFMPCYCYGRETEILHDGEIGAQVVFTGKPRLDGGFWTAPVEILWRWVVK